MLKPCKYSGCAVCHNLEDRELFKGIYQSLHPDIYICEHAMYSITNAVGNKIIIPELNCIPKYKRVIHIRDIYSSDTIFVTPANFEVVCTKTELGCDIEPYVMEFVIP